MNQPLTHSLTSNIPRHATPAAYLVRRNSTYNVFWYIILLYCHEYDIIPWDWYLWTWCAFVASNKHYTHSLRIQNNHKLSRLTLISWHISQLILPPLDMKVKKEKLTTKIVLRICLKNCDFNNFVLFWRTNSLYLRNLFIFTNFQQSRFC